MTGQRIVSTVDDLRVVAGRVTEGRPAVLLDRQGWPVTVQVRDQWPSAALWLVTVGECFAAPRFACELAGEWRAAAGFLREHGPLTVLHVPGDGA